MADMEFVGDTIVGLGASFRISRIRAARTNSPSDPTPALR
jgi:hypothetical protein